MKVRPPSPSAFELQAIYEDALRARRAFHGAAESTVDAVMFSLRERGLEALADPDCRRRLAQCLPRQVGQVIARLDRIRGRWPAITDELLTALGQMR